MTMAPSEADARFDRTVDRWFRDQLAMHPEYATHFGIHDHDADLASGGRDAIDEEVAFYRRTIDELTPIDASELSGERALDRDLAIHQARLGIFWRTEYRPWPAFLAAPSTSARRSSRSSHGTSPRSRIGSRAWPDGWRQRRAS